MTALLEDYALIGDRRTAALVCRNGSIDWLCWPRFDSDACFAALLGNETNGRWLFAPDQPGRVTRRYQTDTLILETDFETAASAVRVIDFMPPPHTGSSILVRLVVGLRGQAAMKLDIDLRFDYGKVPPWIEPCEDGFVARIGPDLVVLRSAVPVEHHAGGAGAGFVVSEGQRLAFTLQYPAIPAPNPRPPSTRKPHCTTRETTGAIGSPRSTSRRIGRMRCGARC